MDDRSWVEGDIIGFMRKHCADAVEAAFFADDCAILHKDNEHSWLITQDSLIERVHFNEHHFSPQDIAHKSFHTALSDIAAMGGDAHYILLTLSIPQGKSVTWVTAFLEEIARCAKDARVSIIGGDTTRSPGPLMMSTTVLGSVRNDHLKRRSTAKPGNLLAITGEFGKAALGLRILDDEDKRERYSDLVSAQKRPHALLGLGTIFGQSSLVTAMLDVSDGIIRDTENLCRASMLSAHIDCRNIPISQSVEDCAHELGLLPLRTVFEGGEDYGLLVALDHNASLAELSQLIANGKLTVIGHLSHGAPRIVFEHAPAPLLESPPIVFEHGGG